MKGKYPLRCPTGEHTCPLLFLIHVNDIYMGSDKLTFYLFADDTNLLYTDKNLKSSDLPRASRLSELLAAFCWRF